jgi:hypothetical protein
MPVVVKKAAWTETRGNCGFTPRDYQRPYPIKQGWSRNGLIVQDETRNQTRSVKRYFEKTSYEAQHRKNTSAKMKGLPKKSKNKNSSVNIVGWSREKTEAVEIRIT